MRKRLVGEPLIAAPVVLEDVRPSLGSQVPRRYRPMQNLHGTPPQSCHSELRANEVQAKKPIVVPITQAIDGLGTVLTPAPNPSGHHPF